MKLILTLFLASIYAAPALATEANHEHLLYSRVSGRKVLLESRSLGSLANVIPELLATHDANNLLRLWSGQNRELVEEQCSNVTASYPELNVAHPHNR